MAGINRARKSGVLKYASLNETTGYHASEPCVFISYHHLDKEVAEKIANYLTKVLYLDIYFDDYDQELKKSLDNGDDLGVTKAINTGIENSTDILCIVSSKTKESWWVPYELGYAKKKNVGIASLKIKGEGDFPSYLKIEKTITDFADFSDHYKGIRMNKVNQINETAGKGVYSIGHTAAVKELLY